MDLGSKTTSIFMLGTEFDFLKVLGSNDFFLCFCGGSRMALVLV